MDLNPYVEALRHDLVAAASAGTEETRRTAELLAGALDSSVRLCLVDALSAAADEITAIWSAAADQSDDASGSVEVRMRGREPQIVVTPPQPGFPAPPAPPPPPAPPAPPGAPTLDAEDDGVTARLTVRLPEGTKSRAEDSASSEGVSLNAWITRVVNGALSGAFNEFTQPLASQGRSGSGPGKRFSGYARS